MKSWISACIIVFIFILGVVTLFDSSTRDKTGTSPDQLLNHSKQRLAHNVSENEIRTPATQPTKPFATKNDLFISSDLHRELVSLPPEFSQLTELLKVIISDSDDPLTANMELFYAFKIAMMKHPNLVKKLIEYPKELPLLRSEALTAFISQKKHEAYDEAYNMNPDPKFHGDHWKQKEMELDTHIEWIFNLENMPGDQLGFVYKDLVEGFTNPLENYDKRELHFWDRLMDIVPEPTRTSDEFITSMLPHIGHLLPKDENNR